MGETTFKLDVRANREGIYEQRMTRRVVQKQKTFHSDNCKFLSRVNNLSRVIFCLTME